MDCLLRLNPSLMTDLLVSLHEMESTLSAERESEAYAKALEIELRALHRKGDVTAIQAKLEEADALSRVGTPLAQCRAHCTSVFHQFFGVPESALASTRKAVELAEAHNFVAERPIAVNRLIVVLTHQVLLASTGGLDRIADAEEEAALVGDLLLRVHLRQNRGVWHLDTGNYDAAEVAFGEARQLVESEDSEAGFILDVNCGELNLGLERNLQSPGMFRAGNESGPGIRTREHLPDRRSWFGNVRTSCGPFAAGGQEGRPLAIPELLVLRSNTTGHVPRSCSSVPW